MSAATSGVCIVRVETQGSGVLVTVTTEHYDGSTPPCTRRVIDIDSATGIVHDFLTGFHRG
ncbi:MAG: hypothetical protein ABW137_10815 [Mycobacterium sp.]